LKILPIHTPTNKHSWKMVNISRNFDKNLCLFIHWKRIWYKIRSFKFVTHSITHVMWRCFNHFFGGKRVLSGSDDPNCPGLISEEEKESCLAKVSWTKKVKQSLKLHDFASGDSTY
jgi:hypothetical protein